jgi:glycosyltransferase involved in cell wall biosynthesis
VLDKLPSDAEPGSGAAAQAQTSLAVLIVGMHRSGTSALSGVLNMLGVAVPEDLHPADEHNQRGYFEPERIINFHEALLAKLGSPSNDPLPLSYDWVRSPVGQAAAEELADILDEEFGANAMCLFKDPRICRLMPVWSAALGKSGRAAVAALPYRHPLEVAGSLRAKAGLSRPYSLFMWLQHVLLGERFTRGMTRSFLRYDALMGDWRASVGKLQEDLGLAWPRDLMRAAPAIDGFLSGELRHQAGQAEGLEPHDPLDALCGRTWDALHRLQEAPYDPAAMAEMDAIWEAFEAGLGVFGPLVVSYQSDLGQVRGELHKTRLGVEAVVAAGEAARVRHERRAQELERALGIVRTRLADKDRDLDWALGQVRERDHALGAVNAVAQNALARVAAMENSTSWKLMTALRSPLVRFPVARRALRGGLKLGWWVLTLKAGRKLREREAVAVVPGPVAAPVATQARIRSAEPGAAPHVAFLSGEPDTPGHAYRVVRYAEAAKAAGATASIARLDEAQARLDDFRRADLVVIWRAPWSDAVAAVVEAAKAAGAPVLFDIDDLLMEPDQAKSEVIDGIRSQKFCETEVRSHFEQFERTFLAADYCSAPTELLAHRLRRHGHPAFVLPNGFDDEVLRRSRLAARRRRAAGGDGLVRIGYATGSKTHQRDFAEAAPALAIVLREHPEARLVLFRSKWGDVLDIAEFPDFDGLLDQVERRDMVPIEQLPDELARFDINIAPLEAGNIFCEAKSELKFYEAALVGVPTVASPTRPYREAVREGETGFLAGDTDQWYAALKRLVESPELRRSVAKAAEYVALPRYGPERRAELFASVLEQTVGHGRRAARAFELDLFRAGRERSKAPHVPDHEVVLEIDSLGAADVTVVIPLYNYARFVEEALDSVAGQTLADLDLVVVDDGSTDDSLEVARKWIEANASRFNRALLIRNRVNSGLGFTRNVAFANADTPFVLPLDADNRLLPECAERLLETARASGAAFAYPKLRHFGDVEPAERGVPYVPARFVVANYIDAMALIRRSAWAAAGGYDHVQYGWEDYDFWCRLVELGMFGEHLDEAVAEYRVHQSSMLRSETDEIRNKLQLVRDIERRHPWLHIDRSPPSGPSLPDDDGAA